MDRNTKFFAVIGSTITAGVFAVILLVLILHFVPFDATRFLNYVPAVIAGVSGGAVGVYLSRRPRADEREALIMHRAGTYAWIFLFVALPFFSIILVNGPPPYGVIATLWLYGVWFIAILIFSVTAVYRYWR